MCIRDRVSRSYRNSTDAPLAIATGQASSADAARDLVIRFTSIDDCDLTTANAILSDMTSRDIQITSETAVVSDDDQVTISYLYIDLGTQITFIAVPQRAWLVTYRVGDQLGFLQLPLDAGTTYADVAPLVDVAIAALELSLIHI